MKHFQMFLLFISIICLQVNAQTYLNIRRTDGSVQFSLISKVRTLTFSKAGDVLQMQLTSGTLISDTLSDIRKITFDTTGGDKPNSTGRVPVAGASRYDLSQNFPNPFNPSTIINYYLANTGKVVLKVYDILGNEIVTLVNQEKPAGQYSVQFDARNVSSGIYFYKLTAGSVSLCKKMLVIK
jgi:hypothetical protein